MSDYDEMIYTEVEWSAERWNRRKEMMTDVWKDDSTQQMKEIIALLVMHAPEANISDK